MATYFEVGGQCTAFISEQLKQIGYKNIKKVERSREKNQCFVILKNGEKYELILKKIDE